ncbi:hypothetical protein So717_34420 [Roseobacter cerasinus]|uniref:EF-hand domain-containing protein n=1 Tax=Roseobacter cerasinus TaxID=2602289 RepID=A0A640VUI6_9RHOB|nr:hypothetical protein [Roseobacter cerasinus]GFE51689.1 hypothetical protein So717_34420 [Roseobacter cerasinus]
MKLITKTAVASIVLLSATTAFAQLAADANGDGVLTIDEVQAAFPDITAESFSTMDLNADGALDEAEVQAAQEAGLMPS